MRWHYQWIVVNDFLRRVAGDAVVDDLLHPDTYATVAGATGMKRVHLEIYKWQRQPFMPVEFSVAAYRFGRSMIRPDYRLNPNFPNEIPIFSAGELNDEHKTCGSRPLASAWTIDWSFFFESGDAANLQHARQDRHQAIGAAIDVPDTNDPHALAPRNLRRGKALELPSGQRVARAMGIEPMTDASSGSPTRATRKTAAATRARGGSCKRGP